MKRIKKNIIGVAGVISSVIGLLISIPALLQERFGAASISMILVVAGIVLIAIALGD